MNRKDVTKLSLQSSEKNSSEAKKSTATFLTAEDISVKKNYTKAT